MDHYKKLLVWGMLAMFPAAVYALQQWDQDGSATAIPATVEPAAGVAARDLSQAVDLQIQKISEIDVKILSAKGEILQYEEERRKLIKELEKIQERIKPHLKQARR